MISEKDNNIDDLFKDTFESFEPNVSNGIWENISSHIANNAATAASTGGVGGWLSGIKLLSAALVLGVSGACLTYYLLNDDTSGLKQDNSTIINKNIDSSDEKAYEKKENVFVSSSPIDQNDPLVDTKTQNTEKFNVHVKPPLTNDVVDEKMDKNYFNHSSSIVNLFLTPKTKILSKGKSQSGDERKENSEEGPVTQVSITKVDEKVLTPTINASSSGGYAPLVVSFEQLEQAEEINWDFGDGTISKGSFVEHIYRNPNDYIVEVTIRTEDGREASTSKIITVKSRCIINNIPNIFTPNGDGENDFFYVKGENIKAYFIQIFDIKGRVVFETNLIEAKWDGNDAAGQALNNGIYLYSIQAIGEDGADLSRTGSLTLKR